MKTKSISFVSKGRQTFRLNIQYSEGEDPILKLKRMVEDLFALANDYPDVAGALDGFELELYPD